MIDWDKIYNLTSKTAVSDRKFAPARNEDRQWVAQETSKHKFSDNAKTYN